MKNLHWMFAILLLACKSPSIQQKAEQAVTDHLKQVLNDPASYQPVKFDSVRVDSSDFTRDNAYLSSKQMHDHFQRLFDEVKTDTKFSTSATTLKADLALMTEYLDSMKRYNRQIDTIIDAFQPEKVGYVIHHSFRGRNKMNALVLQDEYFHLDTLFNVK